MTDYHKSKNALATLFTHPNSHPYDSTLVCTDSDGCVTDFISKNRPYGSYQNLCNAGIQIISPDLLDMFKINGKADLDRDILAPAVKTGRIYSYKSPEYVRDMGTPERLKEVEADIIKGLIGLRHLGNKQKAIFLDRDGTINVYKGFITKADEIELIKGVPEAINILHSLGYLIIVITNQPVISRGECTKKELFEIHNRMETLLGEKGAFIDAIYYCPHHPDRGFHGEIEALKIKCSCRKPEPGLLYKAAEDFNIDLSSSYMIGDSMRDINAGINAGCKTVAIGKLSETISYESDIKALDVYGFACYLQNKEK